jgi:hypothetical protein
MDNAMKNNDTLELLRSARARLAASSRLEIPTLDELESSDRGGCGWLASATLMFWDMAVAYETAGDSEHAGYAWQLADNYYLEYIECVG